MTMKTERDEVLDSVTPSTTAEIFVVNLQPLAISAVLAFPSIAFEHFPAKFAVRSLIQPHSGLFLKVSFHEATFRDSTKHVCWSGGRKRKNRFIDISSTSGFPLSRFAPARKSAQIISR